MELVDVLSADRIVLDLNASSKKTLLEAAAQCLAGNDDDARVRMTFESLCQRERLGSTGLGGGAAIPHGRVANQSELRACLIRLRHAVNFDAPDGQAVDIVLALTLPEQPNELEEGLLGRIAKVLGSPDTLTAVRQCQHAEALMALLANEDEGGR